MKKLLLLFLIAAPNLLLAQDNKPIGDFYMTKGTIIYRHVFDDSLDSAFTIVKKLAFAVPFSSCIKNADGSGYTINGSFDRGQEKAHFIIEVKNGKYRVTIKDILSFSDGYIRTLENTYITYNGNCIWEEDAHDGLPKLDKTFTDMFSASADAINNNW